MMISISNSANVYDSLRKLCASITKFNQAILNSTHLLGKLVKLGFVRLLLPYPPGWSRRDALKAPVIGERVVEDVECVAGNVHLVHLGPNIVILVGKEG